MALGLGQLTFLVQGLRERLPFTWRWITAPRYVEGSKTREPRAQARELLFVEDRADNKAQLLIRAPSGKTYRFESDETIDA